MNLKTKTSKVLTFATVAMATLLAANSASADAVLYEGFDYTDTDGPYDIIGNGTGVGWSGVWGEYNDGISDNPMADVRSDTTQTYGSLPVSGLGATSAITVQGSGYRMIGNALSNPGLLNDGAELWFSILVNRGNKQSLCCTKIAMVLGSHGIAGDERSPLFFPLHDNNGVDGQGIGIFQSNYETYKAGYWNPDPSSGELVDTTLASTQDVTHLIVGQIVWGTGGGDETLTIYNPDGALVMGSAIATQNIPDLDQALFNQVSILTKDYSMLDEIRFGASYADVTGAIHDPGSIGDFLWEDLNGDGAQDAGEPGLAGITVFIDANKNGTLDGGETSTTTDGAGAYDLTGLISAGTYRIAVDPTTVPDGYVLTTPEPTDITITGGEDYNDADFGFQPPLPQTVPTMSWSNLLLLCAFIVLVAARRTNGRVRS